MVVAGGAVELLYYRNSFTHLEAFFGGQRGEALNSCELELEMVFILSAHRMSTSYLVDS